MNNQTILVVEDEQEIANAIAIYLKNQGYHVLIAENGQEGLDVLEQNVVHLAIIDIMMPVMDGISMVLKLRETHDLPVIMLSAKSEDIDKITGLNMGADDYMTKPFVPMELLARVNSHLRRYQRYMKSQDVVSENVKIIGGLELNEDTKEVFVDGQLTKLTPIEFKILDLFMSNPGIVFDTDTIYEKVWNDIAINSDTVMVHIRNLREKIEIDPKNPRYIKVVWGIGYKIEKQ
ncbi:response regulator transcription factor [Beduini massiliensis]|uniref:response regulator transcription factor n=1 Tax=Beduini massiliensis TaxID=1585974 RepID=UPI00059A852B|nr:response regulator transcription factor [Beduini massiliensis]